VTKKSLKSDPLYQLTKKFLRAFYAYKEREAIKEYISKKEGISIDLLNNFYPTRRSLVLASAFHKELLTKCNDRSIPDLIENFKGVETTACVCTILHYFDFNGMWKAQFDISPCPLCGNYGYIEKTNSTTACPNPKP
jgi:hypothetical protein